VPGCAGNWPNCTPRHHAFLDAKAGLRDVGPRLLDFRQQTHIDNLVGDLLFDDQLVLGIVRDLNVIAQGNPVYAAIARLSGSVREICFSPVRCRCASICSHRVRCRWRIAAIFPAKFLTHKPPRCALAGIALVQTLQVIVGLGVDEICDATLSLTVGGERIELFHGRGETDDAAFVWLPERRVLASGDFVIWALPMRAIRGRSSAAHRIGLPPCARCRR
jgi:hypothetical protein